MVIKWHRDKIFGKKFHQNFKIQIDPEDIKKILYATQDMRQKCLKKVSLMNALFQ